MNIDLLKSQLDDDAIFHKGLDNAIIGIGSLPGKPDVVCYDYDKIISITSESFDDSEATLTEEEINIGLSVEEKRHRMAIDWYDYNIMRGYLGEYTPIIIATKLQELA